MRQAVTVLMLLTFIGQDISLNVILDEDNFLDTIMYNHTRNVSIKISIESKEIPSNPPRCLTV